MTAAREKYVVALSSVLAAVLLTGTKLAIGLMTGSLGILAEAAHSGLDLAAAGLTLVAVRFSGKAADADHPYGHGKVENLSALFETFLLLVTCAWITYEAFHRLFATEEVKVDANLWAFLVIVLSIVVDVSRSRALYRVARKYGSQALEADALHFSTDIWSSSVVFLGLLGVVAAARWGMPWLVKMDAVAALGVAVITIGISLRLGRKTIADLLDSVPPGMRDAVVQAARQVEGVIGVPQARVRRSGPEAFADVTVAVSREELFDRVHEITRRVEEAVRRVLPGADVVVHAEPVGLAEEDLPAAVRGQAAREGLVAHNIRVLQEEAGGRSVDLHLEMDKSLSVGEAHAKADTFENGVRAAFPDVVRVTTHLEPAVEDVRPAPEPPGDDGAIRNAVEAAARECGDGVRVHDVEVRRAGGESSVTLHCHVDAAKDIRSAHETTRRLEQLIRSRAPWVGRVVIHVEPREG